MTTLSPSSSIIHNLEAKTIQKEEKDRITEQTNINKSLNGNVVDDQETIRHNSIVKKLVRPDDQPAKSSESETTAKKKQKKLKKLIDSLV